MKEEDVNEAAKQFIFQIKGVTTPRFLRALRDEIDTYLIGI